MNLLIAYALEEEKGEIIMPDFSFRFCRTGVGKVQAAISVYEAIMELKPDIVINIGTAGTLKHKIGDLVVCADFIDRDLAKIGIEEIVSRLDFYDEISKKGILADIPYHNSVSTGDSFVTDSMDAGIPTDVIDMEAFGIAQVCKKFKLPFISVKYVTDIIGQNSVKKWSEKLSEAQISIADYLSGLNIL